MPQFKKWEPAPWPEPVPMDFAKLKELADKLLVAPHDDMIFAIPEPAPIPPPIPEPIEHPERPVLIDDLVVIVPGWTRYVTQDEDGYITAWENMPEQEGGLFRRGWMGGRSKELMKPNYEVIIKEC